VYANKITDLESAAKFPLVEGQTIYLSEEIKVQDLFITRAHPKSSDPLQDIKNFLVRVYESDVSILVNFFAASEVLTNNYLHFFEKEKKIELCPGLTIEKLDVQETQTDGFPLNLEKIRFEQKEGPHLRIKEINIVQFYHVHFNQHYERQDYSYFEQILIGVINLIAESSEEESRTVMLTSNDGASKIGVFILSYYLMTMIQQFNKEGNIDNLCVNLAEGLIHIRRDQPDLITDVIELEAAFRLFCRHVISLKQQQN
jgi:hypothetical protein